MFNACVLQLLPEIEEIRVIDQKILLIRMIFFYLKKNYSRKTLYIRNQIFYFLKIYSLQTFEGWIKPFVSVIEPSVYRNRSCRREYTIRQFATMNNTVVLISSINYIVCLIAARLIKWLKRKITSTMEWACNAIAAICKFSYVNFS